METLLMHEDIAQEMLLPLVRQLRLQNVELVGCDHTRKIIPDMKPAVGIDWDTEYTDLKLSVMVVSKLSEAIKFINTHGSGHTDSIITEDASRAEEIPWMKLTPLVFYGMHLRVLRMDFDLVWERKLVSAPIKLMLGGRLAWMDWLYINTS